MNEPTPNGDIYQVVYMSRAKHALADDAAQDICRRSAKTNQAAGLTGLMLFDGERFIQALEGDRAAIKAVMKRVTSDSRHGSISYLADHFVTSRQFGNWSMNYKLADDTSSPQDFLERVKADVAGVQDIALKAAFIGFAVLASSRSRIHACGLNWAATSASDEDQ